jgi:hypothetical protein
MQLQAADRSHPCQQQRPAPYPPLPAHLPPHLTHASSPAPPRGDRGGGGGGGGGGAGADEDLYDEQEGVVITTSKGVKAVKSFDDMGLRCGVRWRGAGGC